MSALLDELAERYGVALRYEGLDGSFHDVPDATKLAVLEAMGVAADSEDELRQQLAVAPDHAGLEIPPDARCYLPEQPERCWGIALQLYALRSQRNWGIGDFADLAAFAAIAARAGADFVGTNPLHAGFLAAPDRRSPFFPSSRRFLNPLYIAVDQVPGFAESMADKPGIEAARAESLVDYAAVTSIKLAALRRLWPAWQENGDLPNHYSRAAFSDFKGERGEPLRRHALFETISLSMVEAGRGGCGWEDWPHDLRSADSDAVAEFAAAHGEEVEFQQWLQWLASVQLRLAKDAAHDCGMRIGLYLDFAVGEAPDGSATWSEPSSTMRRVHIGAPPDYFSSNGQDWALAPLSPVALMEQGSTYYRDLVGDSMRYAGALRIDHVMGIHHLFLVPEGQSPATGTYVRYPVGRLLSDLADSSHRHRTVIVGEDLGNVPRGFREIMAAGNILSYRILYFERHGDEFAPPAHYPRDALACLSTHDLPTFEGWWRGNDIRLRHEHELIDGDAAEQQLAQRVIDRHQLCSVLKGAGLLAEADAAAAAAAADAASALPDTLLVAIHRYLAGTPSRLLAVRIEDLCGEREPVNLPGTVDSYPNWKRKLAMPMEAMAEQPLFRAITQALLMDRPRQE